jgi:hypothetical protein
MTDISACNGDDCTLKHQCWRYLAPKDRWWQSMIDPVYRGEQCSHFWPVVKGIEVKDGAEG